MFGHGCNTLQEYNEHVHVLLTTSTPEARTLLQSSLPPRVGVPCQLLQAHSPRNSYLLPVLLSCKSF
jgi:hypothetical protein